MHGLFDEGARTEIDDSATMVWTGQRPVHTYSEAELETAKQRLGEGLNLDIYLKARENGESHQNALSAPFRVE